MKTKTKTVMAWHWAKMDLRTQHSYEPIVAGETLTAKGDLSLCNNGMHASLCPLQALQYAPGSMLCRVELAGEVIEGDDKLCARSRMVLWIANADNLLHEFACLCAERALKQAKVEDKRSWAAIQAKRDWLAGKITDDELDAAGAAAGAAAWDAARAAARDAAWAAAWAAARAAARAVAWAAARDAEAKWQAKTMMCLIRKLPEYREDRP